MNLWIYLLNMKVMNALTNGTFDKKAIPRVKRRKVQRTAAGGAGRGESGPRRPLLIASLPLELEEDRDGDMCT
ncbi:hypothetical protein JYU34_001355 [Plutella xylostella]|uniref:Uncharacterized protein n=1 Tax=Plutella xylostella TaxID=51655 RepID=A0ABQ7R3P6_PLUXY|nr:hypothetical protein JYU34_001355 [Plutella xylostella]